MGYVRKHVEVDGIAWHHESDGSNKRCYTYTVTFEHESACGAVYRARVYTDEPKTADNLVDYAYSRVYGEHMYMLGETSGIPRLRWHEEQVEWQEHQGALLERCSELSKMFYRNEELLGKYYRTLVSANVLTQSRLDRLERIVIERQHVGSTVEQILEGYFEEAQVQNGLEEA